jgi:para-aminobenzoate synthetase / 4-amino-4-deoxychorismate lyase
MSAAPIILLDAANRISGMLRFEQPHEIIEASAANEVPAALAALERARAEGRHLAGWFSYELGYALAPQLQSLVWPEARPLLWFGIFDAPTLVQRGDVAARGRAYAGPLMHEWDEQAYAERFARVIGHIEAGNLYQANLSFRSRFTFRGEPLALYLALRDAAQAPYGGYIDTGEYQILSVSPELFFEIAASGEIIVRPMKGTAARGADAHADAEAGAALSASDKNRAENLMIVDLMRNDLGRVARTGSVRVPELFALETYPTLHTLVSTVAAELKTTQLAPLLTALFPAGSVTGAPKLRALQILRELEVSPRGVYCGALGYFAPNGAARFNVAIRTVLIDGEGTLGSGGAVVTDSTAQAEYRECLLKQRYFEAVRRPLNLIETLRWEGGFLRLELHLKRLERSARFFSLRCERSAILAALEAAVRDATQPLRVRLLLRESGALEVSTSPLEPPPGQWRVAISPERIDSADVLLAHKTDWRDLYDGEYARLRAALKVDEVLFLNERGELTEGSRSSLFVRQGGRLLTPALAGGLLDGVLRRTLIAEGKCEEGVLTLEDLRSAEAVWLGSSLRGLIPAELAAADMGA